ncbi:unnamed protein product [Phytophthora fragariaefolia]|uniref:Unnamed protein product n=1 Tax=Phytophthora fragariaefolia TaxID=1490495 RepID=A0A9W7CQS0_9STRA|nr:unnamed protein product [Phytophthora fragariaefolia]
MGRQLEESDHFTPTAAMIQLTSSLDEWRNTTFCLAAAKATDTRLLIVTVVFTQRNFSTKPTEPCKFSVVIQRTLNANTRHSHRIEWSCNVSDALGDLHVPEGWEYLANVDHSVIVPKKAHTWTAQGVTEVSAWELGDELSAYDVLLREVALGESGHFADLNEIEAAWALWTPIVEAAEAYADLSGIEEGIKTAKLQYATYPSGSSPWKHVQSSDRLVEYAVPVREEL